jgi:hypothetical protein
MSYKVVVSNINSFNNTASFTWYNGDEQVYHLDNLYYSSDSSSPSFSGSTPTSPIDSKIHSPEYLNTMRSINLRNFSLLCFEVDYPVFDTLYELGSRVGIVKDLFSFGFSWNKSSSSSSRPQMTLFEFVSFVPNITYVSGRLKIVRDDNSLYFDRDLDPHLIPAYISNFIKSDYGCFYHCFKKK